VKADVANLGDSRKNRMDTHKNASLTPKGREAQGAQRDRRRPIEGCSGAAVQHHAEDCRQVGRAFPRGGRSGLGGPFIEAALIAKPNSACRLRRSRCVSACKIGSDSLLMKLGCDLAWFRQGISAVQSLHASGLVSPGFCADNALSDKRRRRRDDTCDERKQPRPILWRGLGPGP
jgi:hypothetical protein